MPAWLQILEALEGRDAQSVTFYQHPPAGLVAIHVVDSTALGPAAGGIRTGRYASVNEAIDDALSLARAMTLKCALAGLEAGGGKMVVMDHPDLDRKAAFTWLGLRVEELGGSFRTAGDLGTTASDLEAMARVTRYVHEDEGNLATAVGETVAGSMLACARARGKQTLRGLSVAIQGCGSIGTAVARRLAKAEARLVLADRDRAKADRLAAELGATTVDPDKVLTQDVDIVSPCARGGVLDCETAARLSAWAVCGGANNILSEGAAEDTLSERQITFVPDVLSSSGAVIAGVARTVMGLHDVTPLLNQVSNTVSEVLELADSRQSRATDVAVDLAHSRIATASSTRAPS